MNDFQDYLKLIMEAGEPVAHAPAAPVKGLDDASDPNEVMMAFKQEHAALWQTFTTTVDGIVANLQRVQAGAETFAGDLKTQGVGTGGAIKDTMKDVRAATAGGPDTAAMRARAAALRGQWPAGGR